MHHRHCKIWVTVDFIVNSHITLAICSVSLSGTFSCPANHKFTAFNSAKFGLAIYVHISFFNFVFFFCKNNLQESLNSETFNAINLNSKPAFYVAHKNSLDVCSKRIIRSREAGGGRVTTEVHSMSQKLSVRIHPFCTLCVRTSLSLLLPHAETNVLLCFFSLFLKKALNLCMHNLQRWALSCLRCTLNRLPAESRWQARFTSLLGSTDDDTTRMKSESAQSALCCFLTVSEL